MVLAAIETCRQSESYSFPYNAENSILKRPLRANIWWTQEHNLLTVNHLDKMKCLWFAKIKTT